MASTEHQVYRFGDFQINTAQRQLRRADLLIPLDPSVYDTLLALVRRAGDLVDAHSLLLTVWPDRFADEEHLLRNVALLRKALGHMPDGRPYIERDLRRGWRFVEGVEEVSGKFACESALTGLAADIP